MKRTLVFVATAAFVILNACNGRVERLLGDEPGATNAAGTGDAPDVSPDAATAPAADGSTTPPGLPPAGGNDCTSDAECNDDPSPSPLLGRCWRKPGAEASETGACLCNVGAWIQPSGKCGLAEPSLSCTEAGGRCSSWGSCAGAGNRATGTARSWSSCVVDGASDPHVCCIPSSACRETIIPDCYRKGTDAAYTLPCINGWVTCSPGDSPDIEL